MKRCPWLKIKEHHGQGERSLSPSTWRCLWNVGHPGDHATRPSAHQSDTGLWINREQKQETVQK